MTEPDVMSLIETASERFANRFVQDQAFHRNFDFVTLAFVSCLNRSFEVDAIGGNCRLVQEGIRFGFHIGEEGLEHGWLDLAID